MSEVVDTFQLIKGTRGVLDIIITDFNTFTQMAVTLDREAISARDMLIAKSFQGPFYGVINQTEEVDIWVKDYQEELPEVPAGYEAVPVVGPHGEASPGIRWVKE